MSASGGSCELRLLVVCLSVAVLIPVACTQSSQRLEHQHHQHHHQQHLSIRFPASSSSYTYSHQLARPACARRILTICEDVLDYPSRAIEELFGGGRRRTQTRTVDISTMFLDERDGLDEPPEDMLALPLPVVVPRRRTTTTVSRRHHRRGKRSVASLIATLDTATEWSQSNKTRCGCGLRRALKPRMALNAEGTWRYLVVEPSGPPVVTELCPSSLLLDKDTPDRRQLFTRTRLVSFDEETQTVQEDIFIIPSCCQCDN